MAEIDLASRAPENEAAEDDVLEEDLHVQRNTALGEHCVTDRPAPIGTGPSGEVAEIADIEVYVSKPNDYPHQPSKLLLFLTGGTGLPSKNNQLQADRFASEGFLVIMPDMFDKDYAPNSSTAIESIDLTMIEQIKLGFADVAKSFMLDMWLARHTSEKVLPILYKVLEGARQEFADAVAGGDGVYCVGYCLGAKYCLQLASNGPMISPTGDRIPDEEAGLPRNGPHIKVGAIAHGTLITQEDFEGVKSPMLMVCVENDQLFSQDTLDGGEKRLKENNVPHKISMFPGVPHGFAIIGDYDDPKIKNAQELAFDQMLSWLKSH